MYNYLNPMQQPQNPQQSFAWNPTINTGFNPHYEVIKVNGEAGAKNFRMGPNSNALLLDETAPIIWYVQTDGTGYLTATPFDFSPHQAQPPVDLNELSNRVTKLEELLANVQSNPGITKQFKKQRQSSPEQSATTTSQTINSTT